MKTYEIIKKMRMEARLSQEELTKKVGYTDSSSIAKIEAGKVDLPETKIKIFAKVLGITPAELMGIAGTKKVPVPDRNNGFTDRETALLDGFRRLNDQGQEKLIDYMNDLLESPKNLKKDNTVPSIA